jgi:hypothetical protein
MNHPGRITPGLRRPQPPDNPARPPRVPIEQALLVLRHVKPWAARRLPEAELVCFDAEQRQIAPLPGQVSRRWARSQAARIPGQRRPPALEQMEDRRARR